jgi:signal transduction histidine kinase
MKQPPAPVDGKPGAGDSGHPRHAARGPADEDAALRRIATLAARGVSPVEIFAAVARETRWVLRADEIWLQRYLPGRRVRCLAQSGAPSTPAEPIELVGDGVASRVLDTGRPASVGSYLGKTTPLAQELLARRIDSGVGAPIVVAGQLWGVIVALHRTAGRGTVERDEERLARFSELLGVAIAAAASREAMRSVAEEQLLLRQVATLVAGGSSPEAIFESVADNLTALLASDTMGLLRFEPGRTALVLAARPRELPNASAGERMDFGGSPVFQHVLETGESVMIGTEDIDPTHPVRRLGLRTLAGAPIVVGNRPWGMAASGWRRDRAELDPNTLGRLTEFCRLVAVAIANAESGDELRQLAEEQSALRRITSMSSGGRAAAVVFDVVEREACAALGADSSRLMRVAAGDTHGLIVSLHGTSGDGLEAGQTIALSGETLTGLMRDRGTVVRVDTASLHPGQLRERLEQMGIHTALQAPIVVDARLWGALGLAWRGGQAPPGVEQRAARFADALATAIASASNRAALRALADEQAALRRVATLVARGAEPASVFEAVALETGALMGTASSVLYRFESDGTVTPIASAALQPPLNGSAVMLDGDSATRRVRESGQPAAIEWAGLTPADRGTLANLASDYRHSASAAAPVTVEGRLWGAMVVSWAGEQQMAAGSETRLAAFTELVGTAIANSASRAELAASRARLVRAGDEARRRIQQGISDGAMRRLTSLGAGFHEARQVTERFPGARAGLDPLFDELARRVAEAAGQLEDIARGLHPAGLESHGLERALLTLARESAIPIALDVRLAERLPEALEVASYYVVSEAVTNAVKHARATIVEIDVERAGDELLVSIRDDGDGGADPIRGTGLVGLRDRVATVGGRLRIDSPSGGGTIVTMAVPLAAAAPAIWDQLGGPR